MVIGTHSTPTPKPYSAIGPNTSARAWEIQPTLFPEPDHRYGTLSGQSTKYARKSLRAVGTAQAQERVGEDAALEQGVELVTDELGPRRTGLRLDLGQECLEVFADQLTAPRIALCLHAPEADQSA